MGNRKRMYFFFIFFISPFAIKNINGALTIADLLPPVIHAKIFETFIPDQFDDPEEIITAIHNVINFLKTNSYFLQFKKLIYDDKLPRIIKERASSELIVQALQKALNDEDYPVLKILFSIGATLKNQEKRTVLGSLIEKNNEMNTLGWFSIDKIKKENDHAIALFFNGLSKAIEAGYDPLPLLINPAGVSITIKKRTSDPTPFIASIFSNTPLITKQIIKLAQSQDILNELVKEANEYDASILHLLLTHFFADLKKDSVLVPIWLSIITLLFQVTSEDPAFYAYLLETPNAEGNTPIIRALKESLATHSQLALKLVNFLYKKGQQTQSTHLMIPNKHHETAQQLIDQYGLQQQPQQTTKPCKKYNKNGQCILY